MSQQTMRFICPARLCYVTDNVTVDGNAH